MEQEKSKDTNQQETTPNESDQKDTTQKQNQRHQRNETGPCDELFQTVPYCRPNAQRETQYGIKFIKILKRRDQLLKRILKYKQYEQQTSEEGSPVPMKSQIL